MQHLQKCFLHRINIRLAKPLISVLDSSTVHDKFKSVNKYPTFKKFALSLKKVLQIFVCFPCFLTPSSVHSSKWRNDLFLLRFDHVRLKTTRELGNRKKSRNSESSLRIFVCENEVTLEAKNLF